MPANYSGTWDIVDNQNCEGYMVALGIDFATRKVASMLKPQKVFEQDGDSFIIKTFTTFRNYSCSFKIGEEFEEITKGLDNRKCQVENTLTQTHTQSQKRVAAKQCVIV
ncbi:retinoid-binding protein 7-like [Cyprinus carpio]|uniref:Retinoid-binding protein 7-like n=1 Tax=Cyprinus carpio TaxID=7962 RepID=A0A9Q9WFA0_CYPCA|nr:retinoid-binding protein 7-like [Cyprinus carpio]